MKFRDLVLHRARRWRFLAPSRSGAIVRTGSDSLGNSALHRSPARRIVAAPGLEYDGRSSGTDAVEVQPIPADINERPGRWSLRSVTLTRVHGHGDDERDQEREASTLDFGHILSL